MSVEAVEVSIWGQRVGVVAQSRTTRAYEFVYYQDWVSRGIDLAPLTMPVAEGAERRWRFPEIGDSFRGLPGLISDALPDAFGNRLIDAWMATKGVTKDDITALDRLAYMGRRGLGALEFKPARGSKKDIKRPLDMKRLVEEARLLVQGNLSDEKLAKSAIAEILAVGTSAGGARPKAVIAWNPKTEEILSGQFDTPNGFEHWLIKFDGVEEASLRGAGSEYGRREYAYHLMASAAGIEMSPSRLLIENGRAHFMTRRFDRVGNAKLHLQSLCAMDHLDYQLIGAHAYEQYFMAVQRLGLGDKALAEAFRRVAFNVCARNCDDHSKNFAFILPQDGKWALAPAYDITFAFNPNGTWNKQHLMSVNNKFIGITRDDLLTVASRFLVPGAKAILAKIDNALDSWAQFADEAGLSKAMVDRVAGNFQRLR